MRNKTNITIEVNNEFNDGSNNIALVQAIHNFEEHLNVDVLKVFICESDRIFITFYDGICVCEYFGEYSTFNKCNMSDSFSEFIHTADVKIL